MSPEWIPTEFPWIWSLFFTFFSYLSVILDLVWSSFLGASKRHIRELCSVSGATLRYFWKGSGKIREWSGRGWGGVGEGSGRGLRKSLVSDQDISDHCIRRSTPTKCCAAIRALTSVHRSQWSGDQEITRSGDLPYKFCFAVISNQKVSNQWSGDKETTRIRR